MRDNTSEKLLSYIRLPGVKAGKGGVRPNSSDKLPRAAYFIDECPGPILVIYAGDKNVCIPNPHGNTKRDNPSEFVRTSKSAMDELKNMQGMHMNI